MSWKPEYIFLIVISTLVDYFVGMLMEKTSDKKAKISLLIFSLCSNLGLLFFFKYFNFASDNLNIIFDSIGIENNIPLMQILLPVGISFYTFQTLSYTIDIYFNRQKAEKHLGYFALYVSFFPQLVAGPIERFSSLSPQFKEKHIFTYDNLANGLRLILYGLFIKMVIADNLAGIVDQIYATPTNYSPIDVFLGMCFYSFQIYCDFYGYSTIAIGSALLLGIKLMDNFRTPYLSSSIGEFWQRWHISLSTWFRDYLYFPLGGNKVSKYRWIFNIMLVFTVSGIWHGANWNFLIWGFIYGGIYVIENLLFKRIKSKKPIKPFSIKHILYALKTFLLVTFIWVFFRSTDLSQAISIFDSLIPNERLSPNSLNAPIFVWIFLLLFILFEIILYNKRFDSWIYQLNITFRWTVYFVLILGVVIYAGVENHTFIYFQF